MENSKSVEVIEDFEMVVPGSVYPKTIKEGDVVYGRVAVVALQLEKGVEREPELSPEDKAKAEVEAQAKADAKSKSEADQGTLLGEPVGATLVPVSKVSPTGETNKAESKDGAAK
ncbi:hypothetical protein [Cohaesibacter celericrescens]|uniref:Uncharacterized protein n=1 Tax=Cohaesibacter celericrescens TaxID=2067669 RepID=A0A2N5XQM5_9HYPH|nr:hypothetical protein [Cohaesibacter celericrescens]PLW76809.1 hypothetical protein C0081_12160 [Cohaesibacter celericrescens]